MSAQRAIRPDRDTTTVKHPSEHSRSSGFENILKAKLAYDPSPPFARPSSSSSVLYASDLIAPTKTPTLEDADRSVFFPKTTSYENSFASRLYGFGGTPGLRNDTHPAEKILIFRDWETTTPWTDLLEDIHAHFILKQCVSLPVLLWSTNN